MTELFLLPSPEYWLKQLLAAGSGNIFEIARAYRNMEEHGSHHEPEFTMLEFYTVNADSEDSIAITEELLRAVAAQTPEELLNREVAEALRRSDPYPTMSVAEAFHRYARIDLQENLPRERLARTMVDRGMRVSEEERWDDLFHRIFLSYVEPELPTDRPLFLTDYPAAIPTLARRKPGTPWADRWELYFRGVELANCYGEETDRERIATFLAEEAVLKEHRGGSLHPVDPGYLQRPGETLPRSSGVALGVDRLIMLLGGLNSLDGVIYFPISDIVTK